jgi:hypothetical protein
VSAGLVKFNKDLRKEPNVYLFDFELFAHLRFFCDLLPPGQIQGYAALCMKLPDI